MLKILEDLSRLLPHEFRALAFVKRDPDSQKMARIFNRGSWVPVKVICLRGSGSFLSDDLLTARVQGTSTCRVAQEFAPLFPTVTAVHHMAGKYVQYVLLLSVEITHSSLASPTLLHHLEHLSKKSNFISFFKAEKQQNSFHKNFLLSRILFLFPTNSPAESKKPTDYFIKFRIIF